MSARRTDIALLAASLALAGCNLIFGIEAGERQSADASSSTSTGGGPSGSTGTNTGGAGSAGGSDPDCSPSTCTAGQCPVDELTPGYTNETKGMVVTRDQVLWANEVAIASVPKGGGAWGTLPGTSGLGSTIWLTLSDGQLSWSNWNDGIVRGISIDIDPPSSSPFVVADIPPQAGMTVETRYGRIAAFGGVVYWATNEPNAIWRAKADGSEPVREIANPGSPIGVAADTTHVYWADAAVSQIFRKPTASSADAEEVFADTDGRPSEIMLSEGELFWVTDDGAVQSKPTSAPLAEQPFTYTADSMAVSKSVTADDTFVYWTVYRNEHLGGQGEVRRARRRRDDMVTLATGRPYFFEVVVDCGSIYWNVNNLGDETPGTVFRMPKPSD